MNVGDKVIFMASDNTGFEVDALRQKGYMVNPVLAGEELTGTVVKVWSDSCVNLKVALDGNAPDLWITSVTQWYGAATEMPMRFFRRVV